MLTMCLFVIVLETAFVIQSLRRSQYGLAALSAISTIALVLWIVVPGIHPRLWQGVLLTMAFVVLAIWWYRLERSDRDRGKSGPSSRM
jgi:ABC-type nitrate/sulfonate/bicarbonate transport system permease component